MATITGTPSGTVAAWSPTVIAREALRAREPMLVLASRVLRKDRDVLSMGQQVDIPEVANSAVQDVGADRTVQPQAITETAVSLTVNQFKASAYEIGVDATAQSAIDIKRERSPKAGQAIAQAVEDFLWTTADNAAVTQTNNITTALVDADLRRLAQYMEDANAMFMGDVYVAMNPQDKFDILAITRFSSVDFVGTSKGATQGKLSDIYGMVPLVTTRAGVDANSRRRVLTFQREGLALAMQKSVQLAVEPMALKTLYVAWNLFGGVRSRLNHLAFARVL